MTKWPDKQANPSKRNSAKAPYNFVRLPEMVPWMPQNHLPSMDHYHADRHTGYLTCTLETSSPLYVRCGVTPEAAKAGSKAKDRPDFFYTRDKSEPVIPGPSLRGMLRNLIEIVSYSKVQPVSDDLLVYRAVADRSSLGDGYRDLMTHRTRTRAIAPNMKAGYMVQDRGKWCIVPAQKIYGEPFARIEIGDIPCCLTQWANSKNACEIYVDINRPDKHPHNQGKIRLYYPKVKDGQTSATPQPGFTKGVMVKTGWINRKHMEFVFGLPTKGPLIPVPERLLETYREQITKEQEKIVGKQGVLRDFQPVFYLMDGKKLRFFGHAMMFRLPYAHTPKDCVPAELRDSEQTDLAEALFGYVDEKAKERDIARAGRVSVTDATLLDDPNNVWLTDEGLIPQILGTPKPTTFQHYLVQTSKQKRQLRHYGSPTPEETVIRGHKLYWHKGDVDRAFIEDKDFRGQSHLPDGDTQHTVIKPVRSGVRFQFKLHFENASAEELGALLWLLDVAADKDYRLKLGMAKPLGLGAVKVESTLHLTERAPRDTQSAESSAENAKAQSETAEEPKSRYTHLFDGDAWATGERGDAETVWEEAVKAFETWLLKHRDLNPDNKSSVAELTRIQMLLALLSWPGPDSEETDYLQIAPHNQYSARKVLPTPLRVLDYTTPQSSTSTDTTSSHEPAGGRKTGHVKWFNDKKGYGFINVDGQKDDVFVHYSAIKGTGRRSLKEDERVEFSIEETPKGLQATDVEKIEEGS